MPQASAPSGSIYTMPDKFMMGGGQPRFSTGAAPAGSSGGGGSGKRMVIIIAILALFLGGMTAGAYFYINSGGDFFGLLSTNEPVAPAVPNPPPATNQPVANTNTTPEKPQDDQSKLARDVQRSKDLVVLAKALQDYFAKYNAFPQILDSIPKDMLAELPKDPLSDKAYEYTPLDNRASYGIGIVIEKELTYNGKTYQSGPVVLHSEGYQTATSTPPITDQPVPPTPAPVDVSNLDSDSDGLTAAEESLFGTSPSNPDSDSDGYRDNVEIKNFYSPVETAAVKLDQAGLVKLYTNDVQKFSFYYPSSWVVNAPDADGAETLVTTGTGENFSVSVKENADNKTSWEWYTQNISHDYNPNSVSIVQISGHEAIKTLDGLQAYLAVGGKVYLITYNLNTESVIRYPSIFAMMLDHFTLH